MFSNNTKEEFIKLIEFKESIQEKVKHLDSLMLGSPSEIRVIESQGYAYKAILGEIDLFIEGCADDERNKYYLNGDDENL